METISASDARQGFGELIDSALAAPVMIQRQNRDTVVVMSSKEYDRMRGHNVDAFLSTCESIGQRATSRGLTDESLAELLED